MTIVNGNGITGAAGTPRTRSTQAGWNVVGTTDTVGGATVDSTEVVYPPGKKARPQPWRPSSDWRTGRARRRGRAIPPDLTTVAIVLGPEGLLPHLRATDRRGQARRAANSSAR